ncbi:MAG: hypothetical protein ACRDP1_14270 [Nocardioidaceae bacterium]
MSNTFAPRVTRSTRSSRFWIIALAGVAVAFAQTDLVNRAWTTCNVNHWIGLTQFQLFILAVPALTVVNVGCIGLPFLAFVGADQHTKAREVASLVSAVVLLAVVSLLVGVFLATPANEPTVMCQANVPSWWPGWLPS